MTSTEIHETLYDGADQPITFADGRADFVKVRKIPRNEFARLALVLNDEEAECGFYCGQDAAWARALSDDSFDAVLAEGQRLNFPRFSAWFARQHRKLKLMTEHDAAAREALERMAASPSLKTLLGSTSGSAPKATPTPSSGPGARTN